MRPVATDLAWSVCLLDTAMNPTKTAVPIQMPFGLWTRVGAKEPYFMWGRGSAILGVNSPNKVHKTKQQAPQQHVAVESSTGDSVSWPVRGLRIDSFAKGVTSVWRTMRPVVNIL